MKTKKYYSFFLSLIALFLVAASAFAGQVEKIGKFRIDGNSLIINGRERIGLQKNTQIVNIRGDKLPPEVLNDARVILIETDEKGMVKKIIFQGGWY